MPLGATRMTLMSSRKSSPSLLMTPRRKPWLRRRRAELHGGEDARVHLRLRGVGDEEHDEVRLGDDVEGLAEGAVLLGEVARARSSLDLEEGRVADAPWCSCPPRECGSSRLRGPGAPADDDRLDAGERLRELLEWRPPRTMYSPSPATSTSSFSKIFVLMSSSGVDVPAARAAANAGERRSRRERRRVAGRGALRCESDGLGRDGRGREGGSGGHLEEWFRDASTAESESCGENEQEPGGATGPGVEDSANRAHRATVQNARALTFRRRRWRFFHFG